MSLHRQRRTCAPPRRWDRFEPKSTILLALILVALQTACSRSDPDAAFDHALQTLDSGQASAAAQEAERGYAKFHTRGLEWAWKFTLLRARANYRLGKYADVLTILDAEHGEPPTLELRVRRKWLQGFAYDSLDRFQDAERTLKEADDLCGVDMPPACADLVTGRGAFNMQRGHYAAAYPFFERVLTAARASKDQEWESRALVNLSWSAEEQSHFDEALDLASTARKISASRGFTSIAQKALGNMGWAYYKLGDPEKAEGMFIEARDAARQLGDLTSAAGWFTNLGYVYMDQGNLQLAEEVLKQSSDLAHKINSRDDILDSLTALAFVSEQTGKLDDAKRYADEALTRAKTSGNGRDVVFPQLVEGRLAARKHDGPAAEAAFREVAASVSTPPFLKWDAERSLARLYEDEEKLADTNHEYRTALTTFEGARCEHQRVDNRLPFLTNAARIYEDYIHFLADRGKTNEALQVADYARARTLSEGLGRPCKPVFSPDPLNAQEIARRAGGTILFYALGQEHSYLWAITPQSVRMFPLTANQSEIDAAVERFRKKLEGPPEILEASNDGSVLYQLLVAPADDVLKKAAHARNDNVFIIPDGSLNSLNFETLSPQPKHYWIEDVTIVNAPSLRLLPRAQDRVARLSGKLLLIGDPVAPETGPDNQYPELPNATTQIGNIEKYFPDRQRQVATRKQASPTAYLSSHPEQFAYIHFVAHGTASRLSPLDSAIILSRDPASSAASQDDSFKLYARDIIGTQPLRAQLVMVSACYSAGKRTYSGEGLVGLSWAFLRAGAHNVVAALWDVSDTSASQIVDAFYSELSKGKTPGAALRAAKLTLLRGAAFRNPFYWAAFQLYTG